MSPDRSRMLMVLLGTLLAVKFALLPWWEHQQAAIESLQVTTDRLDKSEAVLRHQGPILAAAKALETEVSTVLKRFPEADDEASFRLSQQQALTERLQSKGLKLNMFDWTLSGPLKDGPLHFSRLRLQSTGDIPNIARFISELEADAPNLFIRDVILTPRNPLRDGSQGATVEFSIVADAYFRPRPAKGS